MKFISSNPLINNEGDAVTLTDTGPITLSVDETAFETTGQVATEVKRILRKVQSGAFSVDSPEAVPEVVVPEAGDE